MTVMLLLRCVPTACLLLVAVSADADTAASDPWSPVRFLIGRWTGSASGQAGEGSVTREYAFVLNGRFIRETNTSTYPPQENNREGEVHEHLGLLSYDRARQLIVLRQFHVEGFVNQYVLDPDATTAGRVVLLSEQFENFSNDWRARETYEILSADEFIEIFELAPPGKPFEVYSRTHLRRLGPAAP